MSYLKRILKNRDVLMKKVQPITYNDIRRIREPFFVAVIKEQLEEGFIQTAIFLEKLFAKMQAFQICSVSHPTHNLNEKQIALLNLISLLRELDGNKRLADIDVSNQHRYQRSIFPDILRIIKQFLRFGTEFNVVIEDVLLLELHLVQHLSVVVNEVDDELLANIHYQLGHFYHANESYGNACNYLQNANILAQKQHLRLLCDANETNNSHLNQHICIEFCSSLMGMASLATDLGETKQLALHAIQVAEESKDQSTLGEAHYFYGGLLQKINRFDEAVRKFRESIECFQSIQNLDRLRTAYLKLARSLFYLLRYDECAQIIKQLIAIAQYNHELAQAFEIHAEIHANCNRFCEAAEKYNLAVEIYEGLDMRREATIARCASANCLAKELTENMANLRLHMNEENVGNNIYMEKLTRWKDNREWGEYYIVEHNDEMKSAELLQPISMVRAQNKGLFE